MVDFYAPEIAAALKENPPLPRKTGYDLLVRAIDILAAGLALVVFGAPMLAIAIAIKLQDGGSVFFRQERMGKDGKAFRIFKFRSMIVNAEQTGAKWRMTKGDSRVTRIGKLLREFHLDELPQLFNVLSGQMSLVGPRPALMFQQDYYEAWEKPRLAVTPGMTGLSQVSGGNALNWDERILIDVYYVRHRTVGMYLSILIRTVLQIFVKKGIYTKDGAVKGWTRGVPDWYTEGEAKPKDEVTTNA